MSLLADVSILEETPLRKTNFASFSFSALLLSCPRHNLSATLTFATWGQLQSHVPHFHPQQWSHMFVKMCMLCAFSSPICSHAFSPMSPSLPGGRSRSLTLFIQTEQLGPSQPKQWGMGRNDHGSFQALEISLCSLFYIMFQTLFSSSPLFLSWVSRMARSGRIQLRSAGPPDKQLIWVSFVIPFAFLFIQSATDVFSPFSLSEILFPIKLRHVWNRIKEAEFSLQLCLDTFSPFVALDKAELLLQTWAFCFSFYSALWLMWCMSCIIKPTSNFSSRWSPLVHAV